jgi:hypothetical protein
MVRISEQLEGILFHKTSGVKIIHVYDQNGDKVKEFAVVEYAHSFSWLLFLSLFIPGIVAIFYKLV